MRYVGVLVQAGPGLHYRTQIQVKGRSEIAMVRRRQGLLCHRIGGDYIHTCLRREANGWRQYPAVPNA